MRMNLRMLPWPNHSQKWHLLVLVLACLNYCLSFAEAFHQGQIDALRKETEDLFYHGYENYMKHAFPEDELRPITCQPLTRDRENPAHIELNDPLGNYSLTLIDSLSTLAILASSSSSTKRNKPLLLFQNGIKDFVEQYGDGSDSATAEGLRARGFDLDSKVQVFETAIRGLGGLLSAHLFAVGDLPIRGYTPERQQAEFARMWHKTTTKSTGGIKWKNGMVYDGQLLRLAYDLGTRLLPAFWTPTGIPYPRVNLKTGIPFYINSPLHMKSEMGECPAQQPSAPEITETCSAGAGSLVLEFSVLSRLTGDLRFEESAKRAFWSVWNRRSNLGLIGAGIDAESGLWINSWTGIGAGIDSFFEYALKSYILLSQDSHPLYQLPTDTNDPGVLHGPLSPEQDSPTGFYQAWKEAHAAIKRHVYRGANYQHPHYIQADLFTGAAKGFWIDALSAYYPGVLTLAGHVEEAAETHLLQTALWTRFSGIPERWNLFTGGIEGGLGWWVGRPEFIESTYYLYRATEDPWYLHVGEMVLRDIKRRCWTKCGWASIQNVLTGEKTDRMESFFLGETAKYLFLLFDQNHPLNHLDTPIVFTTEGHPLIIPSNVGTSVEHGRLRDVSIQEQATCPPKPRQLPFSISATAARKDLYHAASLARLHLMPTRDNAESLLGDYAADHPSITLSDISSPSNYTYYPWTLPPYLVPHDAISSPMPNRPTFDISFPALPNQGHPNPPLQRIKEGILINFIGGIRFGMVQDVPIYGDADITDGYRVQAINNIALGKDEKVYLVKDTGHGMLNPTDPNFTRIRDLRMLDVVIDLVAPSSTPANTNTTQEHNLTVELLEAISPPEASTMKSAWSALVSQFTNLLKDTPQFHFGGSSPPSLGTAFDKNPSRFYITAITPTGLGAAPIPDWADVPTIPFSVPLAVTTTTNNNIINNNAGTSRAMLAPPLSWTKIYATDELCTHRLPLNAVRNHQILIIKRGGCSFSQKIKNIPAYHSSTSSLQLVIVVSFGAVPEHDDTSTGDLEFTTSSTKSNSQKPSSENANNNDDDDEVLVRPLLDEQQATSNGLLRHRPIPMVMVAGGQKVYDALKNAAGVGIKRRYSVTTQGIPIANLILL